MPLPMLFRRQARRHEELFDMQQVIFDSFEEKFEDIVGTYYESDIDFSDDDESLYSVEDLLQDMENCNFTVNHPQWMLKNFDWNGTTCTIRGSTSKLLHEALKRNALCAADFLIEECKLTTKEKGEALIQLCNQPDKNLSLVESLLRRRIDQDFQDRKGRSPLHVAYAAKASNKFMKLIATYVNVNLCDTKGDTVLHKAIRANDLQTVQLLLRNGANPNQLDGQGQIPLVLAGHYSNSDACLLQLLANGATVDAVDGSGRTAMALMENPIAAMILLQRGARSDTPDCVGVTPLHCAFSLWCRWRRNKSLARVMFGQMDLVSLLLKQACDINLVDNHGRTALHYACEVCHDPAPEYVEALVKNGAKLDSVDRNGWTPLHIAIACGNYVTAIRLIELGADVHACDPVGRTPIHLAGMDAIAAKQASLNGVAHTIRVLAFGVEAPPPPFVVPPSDDSSEPVDDPSGIKDEHAAKLVDLVLHRGFDMRSVDKTNNFPFFFASNDTIHYLTLHAAACQGLFG